MTAETEKKNIVVIGGGIIGVCSAYYISRHPHFDPARHTISLLEAAKIAGGASGKAGGLLALWAFPREIVPLSFKLHSELAAEHDGEQRWGYRKINCGQLEAKGRPIPEKSQDKPVANSVDQPPDVAKQNWDKSGPGEGVSLQKRDASALRKLKAAGFPEDLDWIAMGAARGYDKMAGPDQTAQVHPYQFTTAMAKLAEESGVKIETEAHVDSINPASSSSKPTVESVTYTQNNTTHTLSATSVVLAAGPWTSRLLPQVPISGLRAHSVTIRPTRDISPYALFTSINLPNNFRPNGPRPLEQHVAPEIYARPGQEAYACGEGDTVVPLPRTTADVQTDDKRCQDIIDYVGAISDELRDGEVTVRQACYLPVTNGQGGPFIGEIKGMKGVVVASGHSCWGIQNAPGTGKVVSELVMEGSVRSARLGGLEPKRNGF